METKAEVINHGTQHCPVQKGATASKPKRFSGQFRLRLPCTLHEALSREADRQGVSLNSYVMFLLGTRHSQHTVIKDISELLAGRLEHRLREVHEMVASMTIGDPASEPFLWQAGSSTSMYQC